MGWGDSAFHLIWETIVHMAALNRRELETLNLVVKWSFELAKF